MPSILQYYMIYSSAKNNKSKCQCYGTKQKQLNYVASGNLGSKINQKIKRFGTKMKMWFSKLTLIKREPKNTL